MRYRSKKDAWLVALLCGITLLLFALGTLYLLLPGIPRGAAWLVLFIGIAMGAFFLALMTTTYYEQGVTVFCPLSAQQECNQRTGW